VPQILKHETMLFMDEKEIEVRKRIMKSWYRLMLNMPTEGLGALVAKTFLDSGQDMAIKTVEDTFAKKATSTLVMRLGAIGLFEKWARMAGHGPFPISEPLADLYIVHLRVVRAPPSRASTFASAVGFMAHVCGIESGLKITSSVRVGGAAWAAAEGKRDVRQAPPPSVCTTSAKDPGHHHG
jgi:hypothetical protein